MISTRPLPGALLWAVLSQAANVPAGDGKAEKLSEERGRDGIDRYFVKLEDR